MRKLLKLLFYIILIPLYCVIVLIEFVFRLFKPDKRGNNKNEQVKIKMEDMKQLEPIQEKIKQKEEPEIHKIEYKLPPLALLDDFEDKKIIS